MDRLTRYVLRQSLMVALSVAVVFSAAVTGFDATDVTWGGSATGVVCSVTGSGTSYTIRVTAASNEGTLVPSIAAGRCVNAAGAYNAASTGTDDSVTLAIRSITVTAPTGGSDRSTLRQLELFVRCANERIKKINGGDDSGRSGRGRPRL